MLNGVFAKKRQTSAKGFADQEPDSHKFADLRGQIQAINRVQAMIHFSLDGVILDANENFLSLVGYSLDQIRGKHHRLFVDPAYAQSKQYADFWNKLGRGEFDKGEYKRLGNHGKEVWLLASYNPIFDEQGKVFKVVKFATDVTAEKLKNADFAGQIEAINKVQGAIEFELDGTIRNANQLFLGLMGYTLAEVQGRHHSIFVQPGEDATPDYKQFWQNLRAGRPDSRVFKRIGKNGREVWIQASYNPILDMNGHPFKVIKFASDLTALITQTETTQQTAAGMATATEQMAGSIAEISRSMELSRQATTRIIATTNESGTQASSLLESMKSMEQIVGMIRGIAGQVNMLALNATIEAARAGEAGKGFAVVANEVKNLSNQTAKATDQIGREIAAVQEISGRVANSIRDTVDGVGQVNQYVASVATAMEEQSAATREISSHSSQMVKAVESILAQTQLTK